MRDDREVVAVSKKYLKSPSVTFTLVLMALVVNYFIAKR